jgi:hypothetical protein
MCQCQPECTGTSDTRDLLVCEDLPSRACQELPGPPPRAGLGLGFLGKAVQQSPVHIAAVAALAILTRVLIVP